MIIQILSTLVSFAIEKKAGKWPSNDENIQFVNGSGLVDPASEEYDQHLQRAEDGMIYGITEAGKYMANECFKFHLRPMREIWKAMQLIEKKNALKNKIQTFSSAENQEYKEMDGLLDELLKVLFKNKE
jgi:hypothetical protein